MFSSYSELATEVYALDKPIGHSFGDVAFYRSLLEGCTGRILEPAVGTGRVLIPLLEAGLVVDGFDNSAEMLAVCRANCQVRGLAPSLGIDDMISFSSPHRYKAIILPAGSFLLIEERSASLAALHRFYEHLQPGGRLLVDLFLPTEFEIGRSTTRSWLTPTGETITLTSQLAEVDVLNQYTISLLRYEKWHDGRLVQTELQRFPLRWYGVEEFKLVLEAVGFAVQSISADYRYGSAPTQAGQTITFEACRS